MLCYSEQPRFKKERIEAFKKLISLDSTDLPETYRTTLKPHYKYQKEIKLPLTLSYSNGSVEATNNHIKVIKRVAWLYSFRNFINFKTQIFLNRGNYSKTVSKRPTISHKNTKKLKERDQPTETV